MCNISSIVPTPSSVYIIPYRRRANHGRLRNNFPLFPPTKTTSSTVHDRYLHSQMPTPPPTTTTTRHLPPLDTYHHSTPSTTRHPPRIPTHLFPPTGHYINRISTPNSVLFTCTSHYYRPPYPVTYNIYQTPQSLYINHIVLHT